MADRLYLSLNNKLTAIFNEVFVFLSKPIYSDTSYEKMILAIFLRLSDGGFSIPEQFPRSRSTL